MTKLRTSLTVGVATVAVVGVVAGFVLVDRISPQAARARLWVDLGMVASLAVIVWVLLGPLTTRIEQLVEALRALARGEKHTRVDIEQFAGLAEIARATNEVGAALCENEDPNLGPVLKRTREQAIEEPVPRRSAAETRPRTATLETPPRPVRGATQDISEHPELGAVRVRSREVSPQKSSTDEGTPRPMIDGEGVSEPRPARRTTSATSTSRTEPLTGSEPSTPASTLGTEDSAKTTTAAALTTLTTSSTETSTGTSAMMPLPKDEAEPASGHVVGATGESQVHTEAAAATAADEAAVSPEGSEKVESTTAPSEEEERSLATPASAPSVLEGPAAPGTGDVESTSVVAGTGAVVTLPPSAPSASESSTVARDISPTAAEPAESGGAAEAQGPSGTTESPQARPLFENDTVIEPAQSTPATATTLPPQAILPSRSELEALFHEFIRAKKIADVDDGLDVDFEAFAETIRSESERLVVEHGCRGVRFEVAVAEGDVSLRPRLVR
jgi:hypothetical protein